MTPVTTPLNLSLPHYEWSFCDVIHRYVLAIPVIYCWSPCVVYCGRSLLNERVSLIGRAAMISIGFTPEVLAWYQGLVIGSEIGSAVMGGVGLATCHPCLLAFGMGGIPYHACSLGMGYHYLGWFKPAPTDQVIEGEGVS